MHSNLKESQMAGPRTRVEPTNEFQLRAERWRTCSASGPSCVDSVERLTATLRTSSLSLAKDETRLQARRRGPWNSLKMRSSRVGRQVN